MKISELKIKHIMNRWINETPLQGAFYLFILVLSIWLFAAFITGVFGQGPGKDEGDFIDRGRMLIEIGENALSDGYRPPLFSIWVSLVSLLVPEYLLLDTLRFLNILLVALIPALWWWSGSKRRDELRGVYFFMALLFAIWPPLFLFAFVAQAEAGSFLFLNILLITLLGFNGDKTLKARYVRALFISVELAILSLLKANNLLMAVPAVLFVFFTMKIAVRDRIGIVSVITAGTIALILPWIIFLYQTTGEIKLTTNGGLNLLVGTGHHFFVDPEADRKHLNPVGWIPDRRALPYKYIHKQVEAYRTFPEANSALSTVDQALLLSATEQIYVADDYSIERAHLVAGQDTASKNIAIKIWQENTNEQIINGILKIAHSYGGSMREMKDYITTLFLILVMIASILAWKAPVNRSLILLCWGFAICGFIMSFFFVPNIRFKIFYFDTAGLFIMAMFANQYLGSQWWQSSDSKTDVSI